MMHLPLIHLKLLLILALLQNLTVKRQSEILQSYLIFDLEQCPSCFAAQIIPCLNIYNAIDEPTEIAKLLKAIALLFDHRHIYWLQMKDTNYGVLVKRRSGKTTTIAAQHHLSLHAIREEFLRTRERPGQFQMCSSRDASRFVGHFVERGYPEIAVWYYMTEYISPLLMHELFAQNFQFVPISYAICGLTQVQGYAGRTLSEFHGAALQLRLHLARQLLELAMHLTYGIDNFRFYIIDFSDHNFAYDAARKQLTIIDLDTVVVVDSLTAALEMHHHRKYIPVPGESPGFTYNMTDFCIGGSVDINVYQACELLYKSLLPDLEKQRPDLFSLLKACISCDDAEQCDLRFQFAETLIQQFTDYELSMG